MIKVDITYRNFESDDKLRAYVETKIGELDKFLPRQFRDSASATVTVEEDPSGREDNRFVCEAILAVHGDRLVSKEGTVNIYAAVDIVEAKLRSQLRSYKDKHVNEPRRTRMLSRLIGRKAPVDPEALLPESD
jgi:putative sigma-54 modulation protein